MTLKEITSALNEIGERESDNFKKRAYHNAVGVLMNMTDDEFNTRESFIDIKGIGKAINDKLMHYKETGELPKRLYELRDEQEDKSVTEQYDPILYKVRKSFVTKRIPLEEADRLVGLIKLYINTETDVPESDVWFLGSYRRKKSLIADLDILVADPNNYNKIVEILDRKFTVLVKGSRKTSYVINNSENTQIDVTCVKKEYLPFSILHFTGSAEHNIKLRHIAKEMGYTLNQYGLYKIDTKERVENIETEKQIFEFLNVDFVEPENR